MDSDPLFGGAREYVQYPSAANCLLFNPPVTLNPGDRITPYRQEPGQKVGVNPYWVYGSAKGHNGRLAGYYIDYPSNALPGVPSC